MAFVGAEKFSKIYITLLCASVNENSSVALLSFTHGLLIPRILLKETALLYEILWRMMGEQAVDPKGQSPT